MYVDLATYYDDVIALSKFVGQRDCELVFWIDNANAPYVITKPLYLLKGRDRPFPSMTVC